jgi:NAD(P)-dependent dehydrogenase (short-subunit alcohol dehydrogenase family)
MNQSHLTVMITGAAGNLGRGLAEVFAAQGANLVLVDLKREALEKTYGAADEAKRLFAAANLLEQAQVDAAVAAAIGRFGRIDVLCNIAGGFRMGEAVHETTDANWNFLFDLNARTVMHAARAVVPRMLNSGGGKIINIGAFAAQKGAAQMGPYIAAKGAVIRLTETMAAELREKNINVNCILPTVIDTPENRKAMPDADPARWVPVADIAATIAFLASEGARSIHGAAIPVTGLS